MIIPIYTQYLDTDEPVMLLDAQIGIDADGSGIDGHSFAKELMWLDTLGKKRICIYINSPGGVVDEGFSIYNAILQTTTPVDTYNIGIAASTAGWVFEAGRVRYMNDYAKIMMHNPYIDGDASPSDKKALREIKHSICVTIAKRSGHTEEEIAVIMERETWINADEAIEQGFADVINDSSEFNKAKTSISTVDILSAWKEGAKIFNRSGYIKIRGVDNTPSNTKNKTSMNKIAKSLGLSQDATEEQILAALKNFKSTSKVKNDADGDEDGDGDGDDDGELCDRMDNCEKNLADVGKGIDDLSAKHDDLSAKHDSLKAEHDAFGVVFNDMKARMDKYEAKDDEDEQMDNESAVSLINKYGARLGTLDVKTMTNWIKKAAADPTATEAELMLIPLNVKSQALTTASSIRNANTNTIPPAVTADNVEALSEWYARQHRAKK